MSVFLFQVALVWCLILVTFPKDGSSSLQSHCDSDSCSKYTVIIDAGSTGSRVHVYHLFPIHGSVPSHIDTKDSEASEISEKRIMTTNNFSIAQIAHKRVQPSLSVFADKPTADLYAYLDQLVEFAAKHVPTGVHAHTSISLKATAGMRTDSLEIQDMLISHIRDYFRASVFSSDPHQTRVITGEEEALFALTSVRTMLGPRLGNAQLLVADLGSSSKQLAFELASLANALDDEEFIELPSSSSLQTRICDADWSIQQLRSTSSSGNEDAISSLNYTKVFARSVNGLGLIAAMDEVMLEGAIGANEESLDNNNIRQHPCYPVTDALIDIDIDASGLDIHEYEYISTPQDVTSRSNALLTGAGNFTECRELIRRKLSPQAHSVLGQGCDSLDQTSRKQADNSNPDVSSVSLSYGEDQLEGISNRKLLVGIDNFAKVLQLLNLPRTEFAGRICSNGINDLHSVVKQSCSAMGFVSPREVAEAGERVCSMSWQKLHSEFPKEPAYRAQRACFGAAYVYSLLVDVYAISEEDDETFLPLDELDGFDLSWPIGAVILENGWIVSKLEALEASSSTLPSITEDTVEL